MGVKYNPLIFTGLDFTGITGGNGDVVGPSSSTDNAIARFDGTTGKSIQNSAATIDDSGNLTATNFSGASSGTNTGDVTLTAVGSTPSADAASLSGQALTLQPADATHPGVLTTGSQTISGQKTFSTGITGTLTGSASLNVLTSALGNLTDAGTDGIIVTGGTGATVGSVSLAQHVADSTHNGYLSSTDWSTFNNKQAALTIGDLTDAGTDGIVVTGGTGAVIGSGTSLAQHVADTTHNGYLSSTDWNTFNSKQAGPLTGDVTTSGAAATVAKIQGTTVSGTTGSTNVVFSTAPTLSNPVVGTQSQGDSSTKAASTAYVDVAIANAIAGVNPAVAVQAATTSASDTSSYTYNNGVSGIGATLTGPLNTALTVDGYTFTTLGQRLLVKNDTQSPSGAFNGVYYVTQVQALGLPLIFTRALDYDTPSDMNNTGSIPVVNGTVNGTTSWVLTSLIATVGTDPLTFTQFTRNPADYLLKANNLSDVSSKSTSFNNLSPMTTGGDLIYGGASGTGTRLANGSSGQVLQSNGTTTAPSWTTNISGNAANVTGTVVVANGGTGQTSLTAHDVLVGNGTSGITQVAPSATSGVALISNGSSADPSFGTVVIAGGGTGQITKAAAFDALSPMTTGGDIIYGGSSGTGTRLANGSSGQVLTSNGTTLAPSWQTSSSGATGSYSQAFTTTAASWSTSSTSYADPTVSGTPALTIRQSSGLTLTQAGSNFPGITFTPASSNAIYLITASLTLVGNAANYISTRLYDGTTVIAQGADVTPVSTDVGDISITGIYVPGTGSAVTVRIQMAVNNTAGPATIGSNSPGLGNPIEWTVLRIA